MVQADTSRRRRREPQMDPELGITLTPAYCTRCGRFLGLEHIEVGAIKVLCPNCKKWITLIGESGLFLTEVNNGANIKE